MYPPMPTDRSMTPYKPPTRCRTTGCPELSHTPRCTKHSREYEAKRRATETWRDYGAEWKGVRARVLKAEPQCRICSMPAKEVDHIISLKEGGTHAIENLRPLCKPCHSRRTYYDTLGKSEE